ncbi:BspA family leucine-rich repeat surface protein [Sulfurovum sp. bin170]|uniref:BspA family leucine-rich repeat surface protein n=1 Tax=Sulfurovum sp. bin170 TaxID=2695268 RepID=UPI0013DE8177|nr:BspA family leucine-rich repeat surface protein [Sulfurovum sp. bin170]NEW60388.1 BspA family leucine-rich repeat surface protein [Sulfurovum sp. bin170]
MKRVIGLGLITFMLLILTACGDGDSGGTSSFTGSSTHPVITSKSQYEVEENEIGVMTITATDTNQESLTYFISGEDAISFDINTRTGDVIFRNPPNYDIKSSYNIIIIVRDIVGNESSQNISINIKKRVKIEDDITPPEFKSPLSFSVKENQIDIDRVKTSDVNIVNYSISGSDANLLSINSVTGVLTFQVSPDYELKSSYSFTVTARDSVGNESSQNITIKIIDVVETGVDKEAPIFTIVNTIGVKENQIDVMTLRATDTNSISYSISGTDANSFNINSLSGVITFKNTPDYERKSSYRLTVMATDSKGNSATENITVNIIDIYESSTVNVPEPITDNTPPIFTSSTSVSVNENQTNAIKVSATDTNSITFSISGTDASSFNINSSTGVVTFKTAPDYEVKSSYSFTARATDSKGNSSTQTLSITILDISEVDESVYFITTWKTDNNGVSNNNQITIPTTGGGYNYRVDWGDGTTDEGVAGDITHTYSTIGTYTVEISGDFPRITFGRCWNISSTTTDSSKLLSIEQWGDIRWTSMEGAFAFCDNLTGNAIDVPDLSNVTDTCSMFMYAEKFNQDIGDWDVSNITNMGAMFGAAEKFNQDIGNWNVSKVNNMIYMFDWANSFNQDIGRWDVSNVTNMEAMFHSDSHPSFNQDISNWNVANVTNISRMFSGASSFSNHDLSSWNVSKVTNYSSFSDGWGTGNIEPNW